MPYINAAQIAGNLGKDAATSTIPSGQELLLTQSPDTFAQAKPSSSLFACNKAADHAFRIVGRSPRTHAASQMTIWTGSGLHPSVHKPICRLDGLCI